MYEVLDGDGANRAHTVGMVRLCVTTVRVTVVRKRGIVTLSLGLMTILSMAM